MASSMGAPDPRPEASSVVVADQRSAVVLPDEFLAYVEILRCADPEAYAALDREVGLADPWPARVEAAAHERRASMLAALEGALADALEVDLRADRDPVA